LWIPDQDFFLSLIPDPGVKKATNPGSRSATLNDRLIRPVFKLSCLGRDDDCNICCPLGGKFHTDSGNYIHTVEIHTNSHESRLLLVTARKVSPPTGWEMNNKYELFM
jgi:hypothetical protein